MQYLQSSTTGVQERPCFCPAQRQSPGREWPNCTSRTSTDGSGSPARSSRTETQDSHHILQRPYACSWGSAKTYQQHTTHRQMGSRKGRINGWSSTCASSPRTSKKTGPGGCRWQPLYTITQSTTQQRSHPLRPSSATTPVWTTARPLPRPTHEWKQERK
jgi:hypothetical protein